MKLAAAILLAALPGLSGCVAAVVPVVASAAIGKNRLDPHADSPRTKRGARRAEGAGPAAPVPALAAPLPPDARLTLLPAGSTLPPPISMPVAAAPPAGGWRGLVRHVAQNMVTPPVDSVMPRAYGFAPCGSAPAAVVLDADIADPAAPDRADASASLGALAAMGARVVLVANDAAAARAAWRAAGFAAAGAEPPVVSRADRRATAQRHCVLAIGGRRAADFPAAPDGVPAPWDAGWFVLPGPAR